MGGAAPTYETDDVASQYLADTEAYGSASQDDLCALMEDIDAEQIAQKESLPPCLPTSPRARANKKNKEMKGGWDEDRKKAKLLEEKVHTARMTRPPRKGAASGPRSRPNNHGHPTLIHTFLGVV